MVVSLYMDWFAYSNLRHKAAPSHLGIPSLDLNSAVSFCLNTSWFTPLFITRLSMIPSFKMERSASFKSQC